MSNRHSCCIWLGWSVIQPLQIELLYLNRTFFSSRSTTVFTVFTNTAESTPSGSSVLLGESGGETLGTDDVEEGEEGQKGDGGGERGEMQPESVSSMKGVPGSPASGGGEAEGLEVAPCACCVAAADAGLVSRLSCSRSVHHQVGILLMLKWVITRCVVEGVAVSSDPGCGRRGRELLFL